MTVDTHNGDEKPEAIKVIVWLHGDHLSEDNPALRQYPDAPVIFVFDRHFLQDAQFAFHRLFFIYESVQDVFNARKNPRQCSLRLGTVVDEVTMFAQQHKASRIVTTHTLGDRFAAYCEEMEKSLPVETLSVPSLVGYDSARVPARFSGWWRDVEAEALH